MTALSRLFLDLSRRCRRHPIFLHRKFSKNLPTDYRKVRGESRRIEEKSVKKLTKEKDKNVQKDNEANIRVCIIGGGVTPLYTAILLKQYKIIKSIRLVDTKGSSLEALTDISQLETSPRIDYFREKDIKQALRETQRKTLLQSFRASDKETRIAFDEDPSLPSGTAATKLIINLAAGLSGFNHIIICAYVRSDVLPICRFFTSELELGSEGVKRNFGLPKISAAEVLLIERAIPLINEHVDTAVNAVRRERMCKTR
ncbi:PREDICTED: uncharacterized protein LOC105625096 [Atta cephalotes]|uniref:Lactate/malate dehydrogenase N-terminal domain-containing protein n=1 Tax=Atta cephalotes TaxID=12957 RepID=A0A158NWC0_ATTCE|nr:PREDICTED: uncharacterized protein LOC105625096 [Atta cephalotes]